MTDSSDIWWTRGVAHHQRGELAQALHCYLQIPPSSPHYPMAIGHRGVIAAQTGRLNEAVTWLRHSLQLAPHLVESLVNLGNVLADLGQLEEAEACCQRALELKPDSVNALNNLGTIWRSLGRLTKAGELFRRVLVLEPDHVEAINNLGNVFYDLGQESAAEGCYRQALALQPGHVGALGNLGAILSTLGRLDEAESCCRQALARRPDHADAIHNLGKIQQDRGRPDRAEVHYRQALAHQPDHAEALANLGTVLTFLGRLDESEAVCRQALARRPDHAGALTAMGVYLTTVGQPIEAAGWLEKALTPPPESEVPDSRLAATRKIRQMGLLYRPDLTALELFRLVRCHAETFSVPPQAPGFPNHAFDPEKRLRIGYLSSDFHDHSVAHNLLPLFLHHDRQDHEVFCYALGHRQDEVTERLRSLAHRWHSVAGHSDETIAALLREDRLDLLVLLAGHFDANRPELCRYRAAPVQVSLFDATSSGFTAMDWWLTDPFLHPNDADPEQFTEQLYRLPCLYQYEPPEAPADTWDPPVDHCGFITFGSFNNPGKLNDSVLDCWANLLQHLPTSRLRLKYKSLFGNAGLRQRIVQRFARHGVAEERLLLWSAEESQAQHLAHHRAMDIALDPFPFNGATTTFQALSMGVPVLCLLGDRFLGRMSASLLQHLQAPELIATSQEEYVAKASALAVDRERLREYHRTLRHRVLTSPLCHNDAYAASIMTAFREMWRARCRQTTREEDPS